MIKSRFPFSLLTAGFLFLFLWGAAAEENNRPGWRMTGFTISSGTGRVIQTMTIRYDKKGRPVEIISAGPGGVQISRKTVSYTDSGKISVVRETKADSTVQTDYTYDSNGYTAGIITSDDKGNPLVKATYRNDDRGNPVEWSTEYSRGGGEPVHFLCEYDKDNRVIQTTELDPSGNPVYYSRSVYNDAGKEKSYTIYTPEGDVDQQLLSSYTKGFLSRTDIVDGDGNTLYRTIYELNDSGLPTVISNYNQYGDKSDYQEIHYNRKGLETERISYNYAGDIKERITKEFDEAGNNIKVTIFDPRGNITSITENTWEKRPLALEQKDFQSLVFPRK